MTKHPSYVAAQRGAFLTRTVVLPVCGTQRHACDMRLEKPSRSQDISLCLDQSKWKYSYAIKSIHNPASHSEGIQGHFEE